MQTTRKIPSKRPSSSITFSQYQREVEKTDDTKKFLVSLLGLIGELGDIQTVVKRQHELNRDYPNFRRDLAEEIGDTLWYLASLASRLGLKLQEIAEKNVKKAKDLHNQGNIHIFDKLFPKDEQFPRQFQVVFEEKDLQKSNVQVKIMQNDVFIGDALTDNAHKDDGYRYHDVFHLAYAAVLGWSPVTRGILRRKRKSNAKIDEVEDGARAQIVEEAISIFLFNQRNLRDQYRKINSIDISLLKTIKRLCGELEVKDCTAKQWQQAIFKGYQMFRSLNENEGGIIQLDLDRAEINYLPLRNIHSKRNGKGQARQSARPVANVRPLKSKSEARNKVTFKLSRATK